MRALGVVVLVSALGCSSSGEPAAADTGADAELPTCNGIQLRDPCTTGARCVWSPPELVCDAAGFPMAEECRDGRWVVTDAGMCDPPEIDTGTYAADTFTPDSADTGTMDAPDGATDDATSD